MDNKILIESNPAVKNEILTNIIALNESAVAIMNVNHEEALELIDKALTLLRQHNNDFEFARANHTLASLLKGRDQSKAEACFKTAFEIYSKSNNVQGQIEASKSLGRFYLESGNYPLAEQYLDIANKLNQNDENVSSSAEILGLLAGVYHYTGKLLNLEATLFNVLDKHKILENRIGEINTHGNIGVLLTDSGRYPEAIFHLTEAHKIIFANELQKDALSKIFINLGYTYGKIGDFVNAEKYFLLSLDNSRTHGDGINEAKSLLNIAIIKGKVGSYYDAEASYRETLILSRKITYKQGEVDSLDGLGNLLVQRGEFALGIAALREALALAQSLEDLEGELDILMHLGQAHTQRQAWPEALEVLNQALERATSAGRPKAVTEAHKSLYEVYKGMGDLERALHHHEQLYSTERALMSEESEKRVQELSARFNLERSQQEAQLERLLRETAEAARNRALEQVQQRTEELEQAQLEVVNRLAVAAEYRDDLTGEHTRRVGHYAARIAEKLGLDPLTVSTLETAARLHDVGKIGIPDDILHKPGTLLPEEFEFMKSHTHMGARILSGGQSLLLRMAEEISLTHHERWDGTGYPQGLAGEAIPLLGRIVAAADVFDALTHERPYKRAWTPQEALGELERSSGSHFDPQVVKAALEVLQEIPG